MSAPPKRRWFRFSLRTMFVVVVVFAIPLGWLAWQIQIVRERKAIIDKLTRINVYSVEYGDIDGTVWGDPESFNDRRVSKLRQWLGDGTYIHLSIPMTFGREFIHRVENAFPEATIEIHEEREEGAEGLTDLGFRDALNKPLEDRRPNRGNIFRTGLIEK